VRGPSPPPPPPPQVKWAYQLRVLSLILENCYLAVFTQKNVPI
jgi:hypothetical protein